jgi:nicotinate-nucleotide adenylyltransferase
MNSGSAMTQPVTDPILVFGGSFNPPHLAHVLAVCVARSQASWSRIMVVPTFLHPFGKALVDFDRRLDMCRRALSWIPGVEVSSIERDLGGASLTLRMLQGLQAQLRQEFATSCPQMRLLVGSDILHDAHKWHAFDEVQALAPLWIIGRAGAPHPQAGPMLLPEVSSSAIRAALTDAACDQSVLQLVPASVLEYIRDNQLYVKSAKP